MENGAGTQYILNSDRYKLKNLINNINLAVGLLAGICTIVLFCRDYFFNEPPAQLKTDPPVAYTVDTPARGVTRLPAETKPKENTPADKEKAIPETNKSSEPQSNAVRIPSNEKAGFFITLIKTPVVYYALLLGLIGCFFVGIYELFLNIFSGFKHGYETTSSVWNWAWNDVTLSWYWNDAAGWHLAVSIGIFCIFLILTSREDKG